MGIELLILVSVVVSIYLYKSFIQPLNLISAGIESLKDKDFNTKFVKVGQREMDDLIGVYNRMIDELRIERVKLKEQHYFLNKLINASPSGIIVLDFEDRISHLNPSARSLLNSGGKELIGKRLIEIDGILPRKLSALDQGESAIMNVDGLHSYKCRKSHFLDRGFHHHFIMIEELTEEILKTEKRAYGKVIRMMSHEVSNSIGAINSILSSSLNYRDQLKPEDKTDFENAVKVAIERNFRLSRFMTNFTDVVKIPPPVRESYDLNRLLNSVKVLMGPQCESNNIELIMDLTDYPIFVDMDPHQMEQVIVNIVKNSIESIGENGEIYIHMENAPAGRLLIRDNGKGISDEVQKNIFAPFFSTKKEGQGLGLTVIREILINHGFDFSLDTKADGYTDFAIWFEKRPH
ncbi:MAG: ATP-binding protein [Candidatus Zixiibacteriota bacterium]|nr:MAG: ATP-binding protein [candidate division Zixibacteria bacterium]